MQLCTHTYLPEHIVLDPFCPGSGKSWAPVHKAAPRQRMGCHSAHSKQIILIYYEDKHSWYRELYNRSVTRSWRNCSSSFWHLLTFWGGASVLSASLHGARFLRVRSCFILSSRGLLLPSNKPSAIDTYCGWSFGVGWVCCDELLCFSQKLVLWWRDKLSLPGCPKYPSLSLFDVSVFFVNSCFHRSRKVESSSSSIPIQSRRVLIHIYICFIQTRVFWSFAVAIKTNSVPTAKRPRLEHRVHAQAFRMAPVPHPPKATQDKGCASDTSELSTLTAFQTSPANPR